MLDDSIVAEVVRQQFPEIDTSTVERLGEGYDNEVFRLGQWIFRFPRFAGLVPWLRREIALMPVIADAVSFTVPRFEHVGEPSALFPYPFVGYRSIAGVPCEHLPHIDLRALARDMGRALGELHAIDPELIIPPPGAADEDDGWNWPDMLAERRGVLQGALPADIAEVASAFVEGAVHRPDVAGPRRFAHNDIGDDHVFVDATSGRLTGLIDFSDMRVAEPTADFTGLITIGPMSFIEDVLAAYPLPVDESFVERIRWNVRAATLIWLADVVREGAGREKHLRWVRRAFSLPTSDP